MNGFDVLYSVILAFLVAVIVRGLFLDLKRGPWS